jgi:hypothetical protein
MKDSTLAQQHAYAALCEVDEATAHDIARGITDPTTLELRAPRAREPLPALDGAAAAAARDAFLDGEAARLAGRMGGVMASGDWVEGTGCVDGAVADPAAFTSLVDDAIKGGLFEPVTALLKVVDAPGQLGLAIAAAVAAFEAEAAAHGAPGGGGAPVWLGAAVAAFAGALARHGLPPIGTLACGAHPPFADITSRFVRCVFSCAAGEDNAVTHPVHAAAA